MPIYLVALRVDLQAIQETLLSIPTKFPDQGTNLLLGGFLRKCRALRDVFQNVANRFTAKMKKVGFDFGVS